MYQEKDFERNPNIYELPENIARSKSSEEANILSDEGKKMTGIDIKNSIDVLSDDMVYPNRPNNQFIRGINDVVDDFNMNQKMQKYTN